jgi:hypothetical protein
MTTSTKSPAKSPAKKRAAAPKADSVALAAVDLARSAAEALESPAAVGEHLGPDVEDDRAVTHYFACLMPAYNGWRFSITVARAPRQKEATVSEALLLPADGALLAPAWVPWSERLRPGDLGPGDLLPTPEDDPRLLPGYTGDGELTDDEVQSLGPIGWELGIGRARVMSRIGRDDAADRWYYGESGPEAPIAQAAPAHCATCAFLIPLSASFRQAFGACANEYSPSDGRVVSLDHGCGAHSEAQLSKRQLPPPLPEPALDTLRWEELETF